MFCYHFCMPVDTEIQATHLPPLKAPRGTALSCKAWPQEAAMRMLMNNLDDEVGERPRDLVVYGGTGKAARNQQCLEAILASLKSLDNDETLLVQSGKPVGIFKTHDYAPRVLIANSNLVGHWSNWEQFNELEKAGLMMYGQMTAGSWIYICRSRRKAFWRRSDRQACCERRYGRHGWRSAIGRDHGWGCISGNRRGCG